MSQPPGLPGPNAAAAGAGGAGGRASASGRKPKKPKSVLGPPLSQFKVVPGMAPAAMDALLQGSTDRTAGLWFDSGSPDEARETLQATFDAHERLHGDEIYLGALDPDWRALPPTEQQAEAHYLLGLLSPGGSMDQTAALHCLITAVCDGRLRRLLLQAGLEGRLRALASPASVAHPLHCVEWHKGLTGTLLNLMCIEPDVAGRLWQSSQLACFLLSYLEASLPAGLSGANLAATAASLDWKLRDQLSRCIGILARADSIEAAARGWAGGHDAARLLLVKACALMHALSNCKLGEDGARTTIGCSLHMLLTLGAAGVGNTVQPPEADFLNRCPKARQLFLASGIVPIAADLLKASDQEEHRLFVIQQHLGLLASSCSSQLVGCGMLRLYIDTLDGAVQHAAQQQRGPREVYAAAASLSHLLRYGNADTCECAWRAGLLVSTARRLEALLAAAARGPAVLAALHADADVANELCKALLRLPMKAAACGCLEEAQRLRLPSLALQLLAAVSSMLAQGAGQQNADDWVSLQRQLSVLWQRAVAESGAGGCAGAAGGAVSHCRGGARAAPLLGPHQPA